MDQLTYLVTLSCPHK